MDISKVPYEDVEKLVALKVVIMIFAKNTNATVLLFNAGMHCKTAWESCRAWSTDF